MLDWEISLIAFLCGGNDTKCHPHRYIPFFSERSTGVFHIHSWTTAWKEKAVGTWEPSMTPAQLESSLVFCVLQTLYLFMAAITLQVQAWTARLAVLILPLIGTHEREELTWWELSTKRVGRLKTFPLRPGRKREICHSMPSNISQSTSS